MTITKQEIAAQAARRMISRISAATYEMSVRHRTTISMDAYRVGDGVNVDSRAEMVTGEAIAFVTRNAAKAVEGGYEVDYTIATTLPVLYVNHEGETYAAA